MAVNYAYHFAQIDPATKMCIHVVTTSNYDGFAALPDFVELPVYDEEYLLKYYINGSWYEDPNGTIPWTSSLL